MAGRQDEQPEMWSRDLVSAAHARTRALCPVGASWQPQQHVCAMLRHALLSALWVPQSAARFRVSERCGCGLEGRALVKTWKCC
jgi:hypothetical protein